MQRTHPPVTPITRLLYCRLPYHWTWHWFSNWDARVPRSFCMPISFTIIFHPYYTLTSRMVLPGYVVVWALILSLCHLHHVFVCEVGTVCWSVNLCSSGRWCDYDGQCLWWGVHSSPAGSWRGNDKHTFQCLLQPSHSTVHFRCNIHRAHEEVLGVSLAKWGVV